MSQLHASAIGETPWTATLARMAGMFNSSRAVICTFETALAVIAQETHGYSPGFGDRYFASDIFRNDPRTACIDSVADGSVFFDRMLYDIDAMALDPDCRAAVDATGVRYQLGAKVRLPGGGFAALCVQKTSEEGHATAGEIEAFGRLLPHIDQACALGDLLGAHATTRTVLLEALSLKAEGVLMLGGSGAPVFINEAAAAMLRAADGLVYADGVFTARRPPETRRLQQLIGETCDRLRPDHPGGLMLVTRPSGKRPYVIRVLPAPATGRLFPGESIGCVIHVQDLDLPATVSKTTLVEVFGLTDREAQLALELARHPLLRSAALSAGMAVNTARVHLQSIFRKTAVVSQAGLIQLLGRLM